MKPAKEIKQVYPKPPADDADGFYFASEDDESVGILTKNYPNGSAVKKLTLSDGRVAQVRKLRGRDFIETKKMVQANNDLDFETVNMSVATEINGERKPPEFYLDDLYQTDYALILGAFSQINFQ